MKALLAAATSFATLCGGHFVNHRLDRAALFLGVFLAWIGAGTIYYVYSLAHAFEQGTDPGAALSLMTRNLRILLGGTVLIWLASVLVSLRDALRPSERPHPPLTSSGLIGGILLSLLGLVAVGYGAWSGYTMLFQDRPELRSVTAETGKTTSPRSGFHTHIGDYLYFAKPAQFGENMPPPPEGNGYLSGRVLFQGQPARGVKLTAVLNGKYETATLTTDEQGLFNVRVPTGEWFVSLIKIDSWADKPDSRDLFIAKGIEPPLMGDSYSDWIVAEHELGLRIEATETPAADPFTLEMRELVELTWPPASEKPTEANTAGDAIRWRSYPEATQYLVRLGLVERRDSGRSSRSLASIRVREATLLPLKTLDTVAYAGESGEYGVEILAFDAQGRLLSKSSRFRIGDHSFSLTDGRQIVDDSLTAAFSGDGPPDEDSIRELMFNRKRLDAAIVLLDEGLVDAAEQLLSRIDGQSEPGRLQSVRGYLAASVGACDKARALFEEARLVNNGICIPDSHWRECAKLGK